MAKKKAKKTSHLKPYPNNPRIHGDGIGLSKSILKHGDLSGIVFNSRNKSIVGGHYRTKTISKESIIESHPVTDSTGTVAEGTIILPTGQRLNYREVDWDEEQHREACVLANNEKIQGDWNVDMLEPILADLNEDLPNGDFEDFGLDQLADEFKFNFGESEEKQKQDDKKNDPEKIPLFLHVVELTPEQHERWQRVKKKLNTSDDNKTAEILILKAIDTE